MRELGFNSVKYWAQWRWSHKQDGSFDFSDLDVLMDLAQANHLQVTINTIFDVAPHWLYTRYPDAKQIRCDGRVVEPYTVAHRQIGGHPGPCYNHPGARLERERFLRACLEHFRSHPALKMWDAWNEPELCFPQRTPNVDAMACYCPHCQQGFLAWLQAKYASLEKLNQVWGRSYESWDQVETPRNPHTITDYVDWREFHIATMTGEAAWRLALIRELDPGRIHYLHVVPNVMSVFNSVACCADDFELASHCQVFAATMNGGPVYAPQVLSAARGKLCYNVESHVNFGMTNLHQRRLGLDDLLRDWLPQVGLGIRGFLFWQYRPEVLGFEAPAWGVVGLDGSDRPVTFAVRELIRRLAPYCSDLVNCPPALPEIAILKSRKNEIFHFCIHGSLDGLVESVEGYINTLYWNNYAYRILSGEMLANGELEGVKLLILPSCYYLSEAEAASLERWVRRGGMVIAEAHLAGYNATAGRHSRTLPGFGLSQAWGLRESDSSASYHLKLEQAESFLGAASEDVRKALSGVQLSGGKYFPLRLADGALAWGAERYAILEGEDLKPEGWFEPEAPCLASIAIGEGWVFYAGTNLGQGAAKDSSGLLTILKRAAGRAGVQPMLGLKPSQPGQERLDPIREQDGRLRFVVAQNRSSQEQACSVTIQGRGSGLFTGKAFDLSPSTPLILPPAFIDLIVLEV
jgi:beta-galactosidase